MSPTRNLIFDLAPDKVTHDHVVGDDLLASPIDPRMPEHRITTLQWAVGGFCALLGALMLVAPHQFSGPLFSALPSDSPWVGSLFLLAGMSLIGSSVLAAPRHWVVASHFAATAALLVLVYNNLMLGFWGATDLYSVLALGTVLAPFVWVPGRQDRHPTRDYFVLVFGAVCASYGALRLALPQYFSAPTVSPTLPSLWLYGSNFLAANLWLFGAGFLIAGAALMAVQFLPGLPKVLRLSAYLAVLLPCLTYAGVASIPLLAWTGIFLYVGFSLLVASLPWTGGALRSIDPRSFSVRLALLLILAAGLPLIVFASAVTNVQEQQARADAEASMQASAIALASDVSHYVGSYRNATAALATYPGLVDLPSDSQREIMQHFAQSYPDANVFSTYDATGRGIARSDSIPPIADISQLEIFQKTKRTLSATVVVQISSTLHVPIFAIGAPIRAPDGSFAGQVGSSVRSDVVANLVNRVSQVPGSRVYLVDATGHAIAHPDQSLVATFADLSSSPQVARLLASAADHGVVSSTGPAGDLLGAYARVPDLQWSVVLDRPAAAALASVRSERNAAFGLLLAAIFLAVAAGTLSARRLADPISALSHAASRLAHGDSAAPLPAAGIGEIQTLVASFGDMRDKLAARTAELERLLQTVHAQNEELQAQSEEVRSQNEELQAQSEELQAQYQELAAKERELRQSEEKFSLIFEKAAFAASLSSLPDGILVDVNEAFERAFGYTRQEAIGKTSLDLTINPDAEGRSRILAELQTRGSVRGQEVILRTKSGEQRVFSVNVDVMDMGGQRYILNATQDITERKYAEAERERLLASERELREQAEKAVRIRNEFLSVAAHELKTPVTSLRGFAQVLLRKHQNGTLQEDQLVHALQRIEQQTRRLNAFNDQLLDVSRLDSGKLVLAPADTEVTALVDHVVASMRMVHPIRSIDARITTPIRAHVDPLRMEQVLTNLVDNAVKFSTPDTPVEIEVRTDDPGWMAISVRDYGRGVPEADRALIFERFYQAHPVEHYGGMGLGLYITAQIVEMHGGTITCEDPHGVGSLFVVRIPIGPQPER